MGRPLVRTPMAALWAVRAACTRLDGVLAADDAVWRPLLWHGRQEIDFQPGPHECEDVHLGLSVVGVP